MFLLRLFKLLLEMGMHLGTYGLIYKTSVYFVQVLCIVYLAKVDIFSLHKSYFSFPFPWKLLWMLPHHSHLMSAH